MSFATFFLIFTYDLVCPKEIIFHRRWTHKWNLAWRQILYHVNLMENSISMQHACIMLEPMLSSRISNCYTDFHSKALSRMERSTTKISQHSKLMEIGTRIIFICIALKSRHLKSILRLFPLPFAKIWWRKRNERCLQMDWNHIETLKATEKRRQHFKLISTKIFNSIWMIFPNIDFASWY